MGWCLNEGPKWVFMCMWVGANIALFVYYFFFYYDNDDYYYYKIITGPNLAIARASAAALNLDCAMILLPVCRNLISFLRGSTKKCCKRNITRQLDKNIAFHKVCAYMICFLTAIHYYAHTFNFEYLFDALESPDEDNRALLSALSNLDNGPSTTWINPIRSPNTHLLLECCKTVSGLSGVIITVALILMVTSSTDTIRRSYFEVFWFTHHLFTIFFIGLVVHGVQGLVRIQSNQDVHNPQNCSKIVDQWDVPGSGCATPTFVPGSAKTWMWVIGPMVLYLIERGIRFYRSQQTVVISKVVSHPSKVIELQMKKKGFSMQAGEYIFLHCPSISQLEWHPFTLTSAPQDDHFSVHIRIVGDWTTALYKALRADETAFQEHWKLPSVAVDGPFGTASEDVFRYQVDVLVGAGIGITPFAAVLKDIWYKYLDPDFDMKLRKVHLFWICPDTNAFEWFADLMQHLESQMTEAGKSDLLDYNIYLTRGWTKDQALNIAARDEDEEDVITGLKQKTYYGRPNWDDIFGKISSSNPATSVGVFFCGPKVLSQTLHKMSNKHSVSDGTGAQFFYNKENF